VTLRRIPVLLAAAVLVALAARLPAASAQDAPPPPAAEEGPTCADCHEEETAQWKASAHSRAMKPAFLAEWEREGKHWECLACHTSQYDRAKGTFSSDGVDCESCHGPRNPDHPDKAKMSVKAGNDTCQACHSITYAEWRLSAHGQKDVGCMACHGMHAMELRKEDPDQQCGSCHTERLQDFAHATHHEKGLHCITCHMPDTAPGRPRIKGTGARGHSYGVGAETCAGCHRVQVHQSGEIAGLQHEVAALKGAGAGDAIEELEGLRTDNRKLKETAEAERRVFPWVASISFVLGLGLGLALRGMRRRTPAESIPTGVS
jgi:hypothetical protein